MYDLIENVEESVSKKVNSEEACVFVESIGNLLNEEVRDLDTSIDDLIILDPQLGDRAERLRCAASASAMKAMSSMRKYQNEDGAARKCSASSSFAPRSKTTTAGVTGDRTTSAAPPPKTDAQKSRDASEPLFKKKSGGGKERKARSPSPSSDEKDATGVEEDSDSSSYEDADGYDRDRRQYEAERKKKRRENTRHDLPDDEDDEGPRRPPAGRGADQGGGEGQHPPP